MYPKIVYYWLEYVTTLHTPVGLVFVGHGMYIAVPKGLPGRRGATVARRVFLEHYARNDDVIVSCRRADKTGDNYRDLLPY